MNENSPVAPLKSRAQIEWPGQDGKAGCRTRATWGCSASQAAIFRALASCWASLTDKVRRPRAASQASSGDTYWPKLYVAAFSLRAEEHTSDLPSLMRT